MPLTRESGSQKVFVPFSRVLRLLRSWLPPSQARVTFQGQRWRRGRQGGVKAGPSAQPTATQVWKRRRVRRPAWSKGDGTRKDPEPGHNARRERLLSDSLTGEICLPTIASNMRGAKAVV